MSTGVITFQSAVDTKALRDDLESVQLGLGRQVGQVLQQAARDLVPAVKVLTPYDPKHRTDRKNDPGHMRDSIAAGGASALAATIVSTHPAAAVFEWNDGLRPAIAPRGVPITIPAVQMAHRAAQAQIERISQNVAEGLDRLIRDSGL